jgi:hypothetical protein
MRQLGNQRGETLHDRKAATATPNVRLACGDRSFAATRTDGEVASIPAVRVTAIGGLKSTQSCRFVRQHKLSLAMAARQH